MTVALLWIFACLGMARSQNYPFPPPASSGDCAFGVGNDSARLDCFPEPGASEEGCVNRGCCWSQTAEGRPWCYYPQNFFAFERVNDTHIRRKYRSQFPGDASLLRFDYDLRDHLTFKLSDPLNDRFTPPYPKLNFGQKTSAVSSCKLDLFKDGALFKFSKADAPLISGEKASIVFADQFVQLTLNLRGTLYGVGEHRTRLALDENWTRYTLWNHDVGPRENTNLYGSHPFILAVDDEGNASGLYFHNSNAMEVLIQPGPKVTFRSIGGILEFHFFLGPSPSDVISQYSNLVGLPAMPPYWALGFHLCRWGYGSANNTRAVWQRMRDAQIPYDVQWNDIDYMENNNDFTIDPVNYAELPQLVDDIHAAGMHYVAMLDPGISGSESSGTYPPYTDAVAMDTLVKNDDGDIFIGHVWNRADTVYPDFTHPRALEYWTKQLREFREKIQYDALWIDMNEPSNFFDGTENGCPDSNLENPPFVPPVDGGKLQTKTLCLTARHAAGRHYDLHNLYSIAEADVTRRAAEEILEKRTFLISRSSFSGMGRYSGHWSGDNYSDWPEMAASIVELLTFSIYGVPFMGSDICGFGNDANRELCNRWMQLGAFYPFSRNHNTIGSRDQDPASFDDQFIESSRTALYIRYQFLPYLYTLFYEAQVTGSTVARPLFFEFPSDSIARKVDRAFLWGSSLYIVPVLEEGATSVVAYLPAARWFDVKSGEEITLPGNGNLVTLDAPFERIPLLIRGGAIIPTQSWGATTTETRKSSFSFLVTPDEAGNATGSLFWDDGVSLNTVENGQFGLLNFELTQRRFKSTVTKWNTTDIPVVGLVSITAMSSAERVLVNGLPTDFELGANKVLRIIVPRIPLNQAIEITWS